MVSRRIARPSTMSARELELELEGGNLNPSALSRTLLSVSGPRKN